jgi:two-component system sensor histidine kinase DesK
VRRPYPANAVDEWGSRRWLRARVAALVLLGFLLAPVRSTLSSGWSVPEKVLVLAAVAGFAACFVVVFWRNTPRLHSNRAPWAIVAALAIGVPLVVVFDASFLAVLTYFVMSMLLFNCRTSRWPAIVLGVPALAYVADRWVLGETHMKPIELAVQALLIGTVQAAFYQQISAKTELRRARAELARLAVTEERLRIARDLHDILGQRLSAVSLKAELAARLAPRDAERAAAEMIEVAAVARAALADVRDTVSGYRQMSLAGEVETARALLTAGRIELDASICDMPAPLDECAGWVVREAVTNVIRHSVAKRCEIRAVRHAAAVIVEVRDDGGTETTAFSFGNGLTGLAERVDLAGGVLATVRDRGSFVVRATFGEACVRSAAARDAAAAIAAGGTR